MKALPKRKGNSPAPRQLAEVGRASMKPLLKRKGNSDTRGTPVPKPRPLNESPSEKEGKSGFWCV